MQESGSREPDLSITELRGIASGGGGRVTECIGPRGLGSLRSPTGH